MALYEWLVVVYFGAFTLVAWTTAVPAPRRWRITLLAAAVVIVAASGLPAVPSVRDWLPHLYLVAGYWIPALLLSPKPLITRFDRWLIERERPFCRWFQAVPAPLAYLAEFAYLGCYPLVPAAFAVVWSRGGAGDVGRFWTAVLVSGYACYVTLPWLVSHPPRLAWRRKLTGIRAFNARVLRRVSHQLNTFPSGHVAVTTAATIVVATVSPVAAAIVGLVTLGVAIGATAGRYHYAVDVVAGVAVGAGAAIVALLV